jgi:hypothetical protein
MPQGERTTEFPVDPREAGREGGKKSGAARRAKAKLRGDLKAREKFLGQAEGLATQMLDAAFGRGLFDGLDPKERLAATKLCLEYGIGRPRQADAPPEAAPAERPQTGLAFRVGEKPADSAPFPVDEGDGQA